MDLESPQTAAADFEAIRVDLCETARIQKNIQRQHYPPEWSSVQDFSLLYYPPE